MTPEEARALAENLLKTQDMRGYKAVFAEAREHERWPNEFSVIFDLYSKSGNLTDGPMIVIVDKTTRKARFFESL
jgi:hypothetical protein